MALPATHFRFALAMQEHYSVEDLACYIAGTLYPDSRWLTGLGRDKTHHKDFLSSTFADSDFTAGWHAHVLCDHIQTVCFKKFFPELAGLDQTSGWITASALKVAQDMEDSRQVDMTWCLDSLTHAEAPQGEELAGVQAYYRLVRETYGAGAPPSPVTYRMLWEKVGVPPRKAAAIMSQASQLSSSSKRRRSFHRLFSDMVCRSRGLTPIG